MKNPGSQGGSKAILGNKYYIMHSNGQKYTHPIIQDDPFTKNEGC